MSTSVTDRWGDSYAFALAGERGDLVAFFLGRLDTEEEFARVARLTARTRDRMLREVKGKRMILARYEDALRRQEDDEYPAGPAVDQAREYEDFVLPNLIVGYSDDPAYDADWAP